jgi:hypothetical protein
MFLEDGWIERGTTRNKRGAPRDRDYVWRIYAVDLTIKPTQEHDQ